MMKERLRPILSVSLLAGIIKAAMVNRKSVMLSWIPATSVFRSRLMSLIITFMFEPAKLQMNCASASGAMMRRTAARVIVPVPDTLRCYSGGLAQKG
jgi:hypothetical protein